MDIHIKSINHIDIPRLSLAKRIAEKYGLSYHELLKDS